MVTLLRAGTRPHADRSALRLLVTVALRRRVDALRHPHREVELEREPPDPAPTAAGHAEARERLEVLRDRCPDDRARRLVDGKAAGSSTPEAAAAAGLHIRTAERILRRLAARPAID
jgi:DNA-directed RNA polymerase specialized sigma24 family protein